MAARAKIKFKIGQKCQNFHAPSGGQLYESKLMPIWKLDNFGFMYTKKFWSSPKLWAIFIFSVKSVKEQTIGYNFGPGQNFLVHIKPKLSNFQIGINFVL